MQGPFEPLPRIAGRESAASQSAPPGYIDAAAMCRAARTSWSEYGRLETTTEFLDGLASDLGLPVADLVRSVGGGRPEHRVTWVHPQVAIHLALWLTPRFGVEALRCGCVGECRIGSGPPRRGPMTCDTPV